MTTNNDVAPVTNESAAKSENITREQKLIPEGVYYTLSYSTNGVALNILVNNKITMGAEENGDVNSADNNYQTAAGGPVNSLIMRGKNIIKLNMEIPEEAKNDYYCIVNLSIDIKGQIVSTNEGGENNILSFSLVDKIKNNAITKDANGKYTYEFSFNYPQEKSAKV